MTIFVREVGSANSPSIVLLHGLSTSGWMWRKQAATLGEQFHVLIPDLPGHGRSNTRPWVSLADTVQAIADVITSRTASGHAHVVGLSLGGYVATQLSADLPRLVDSAIVSGVNVLPFPHPGMMRLTGRLMAPFMTTAPMLRANAKALRVPPEDFPGYRDSAKAMAPGTIRRVTPDVMTFRVPAAAGTSPCRLLAIAGEHEQELVVRSQRELAGGFIHGAAYTAPGVGHAWNGEKPDLFTAMIRAHVLDAALPPELRPVNAAG